MKCVFARAYVLTFCAHTHEHVRGCLCLPMPQGCTRSIGIRVLQSTASFYSRGPGEICCTVTERLKGEEWWRVGVEISCVAHAARGEHQCQALGYRLGAAVVNAALHVHQQQ